MWWVERLGTDQLIGSLDRVQPDRVLQQDSTHTRLKACHWSDWHSILVTTAGGGVETGAGQRPGVQVQAAACDKQVRVTGVLLQVFDF